MEKPTEMHLAALATLFEDAGHDEASAFLWAVLHPEAMDNAIAEMKSRPMNALTRGILDKLASSAAAARRYLLAEVLT